MSAPGAIVIASRGGRGAKSRLAAALDARWRDALTAAMLDAMLTALRSGDMRVIVVSPTADLLTLARSHGADVIVQSAADGLNAAFRAGCDAAFAAGAGAVACLPGDLPLIRPRDLHDAFQTARTYGGAISQSHSDGGTGALILRRDARIEPAFGVASFARHQSRARAAGFAFFTLQIASLADDIDTPAHLAALAARAGSLPPRLAQQIQTLCAHAKAAA